MNKKQIVVATASAIMTIISAVAILNPKETSDIGITEIQKPTPTETPMPAPTPDIKKTELSHRQEVWISALEWCESRGYNEALNPMDRDGTPSFSNFQWKPETLLIFGKKYKLINNTATTDDVPKLLEDYELQREIVRRMIGDKTVNWLQQFPDCVKNKIGHPPK
jgi:hypothetical protein